MDIGSDAEMLTGAELFVQITRQNEEQRQAAEEKIGSYTELHKVLASLAEKTRHPILAPVANGLAYFEAELRHTNEVVVLLGDNWFTERSVVQAGAICQRRLDFLRNELSRLDEERRQLDAKRIFFEQEVLHGDLGKPPHASVVRGTPSSASLSGATNPAAEAESQPGSTFSDEDELTDAELLDLEAELGPELLQDDALVEQRMWEMMVAKRRARLAVFGSAEDVRPGDDTHGHSAMPTTTNERSTAAAVVTASGAAAPRYRDPGDIGHDGQLVSPSAVEAMTTTAASPPKKVSFVEPCVTVQRGETEATEVKNSFPPPRGTIRDVVERQPHGPISVPSADGGERATSVRQEPPARIPKRSLFMQRMLGEEGT